MKIYNIKLGVLVTAFVGIILTTSCNKDFLERSADDQVEAEFFFNTAKDLETATNDFYTMLPTTKVYSEDANSDNIVPLNPSDKIKGNRTVPTARGSGSWSWSSLRKINFFLEN